MNTSLHEPPKVLLSPAPPWPEIKHIGLPHSRDELSQATREALGLDDLGGSRAIIMTGHQAGIWHSGILAKSLAAQCHADVIERETGVRPILVHVVVDQDDNDAALIEYPAKSEGKLVTRRWRVAPEALAGVPTGLQKPVARVARVLSAEGAVGTSSGGDEIPAYVEDGLERIARAVEAHADKQSLALQLANAVHDLIAEIGRDAQPTAQSEVSNSSPQAPSWTIVSALAIAKTTAFIAAVSDMVADPVACVTAYNASVRSAPGAGLRPLVGVDAGANTATNVLSSFDINAIELPLWRIEAGKPRLGVRVREAREWLASQDQTSQDQSNLDQSSQDQSSQDQTSRATSGIAPLSYTLAPKAILMTALLRGFACDLFIHGTGGGVYDRVTEVWIERWAMSRALTANHMAWQLAPTVIASATIHLPLLEAPPPTDRDVADSAWRAHRATHDPAMLGELGAAATKLDWIKTIRALRYASKHERLAAYRAMHEELARFRATNAPAIAQLVESHTDLVAQRIRAGIALRRTWPFAIVPGDGLRTLDAAIAAKFE